MNFRVNHNFTVFAALLFIAVFVTGAFCEESKKQPAAEPILIEPGGGDVLWVFAKSPEELGSGGEFHIYVDSETYPEAKASFAKFALGPGGQLPVHRHDKTEEISYFISGRGVVQNVENGEVVETPVGEGHVWYVPPGTWHAIRNTSNEPLSLIFATIPNEKKGLLSFFRKVGAAPGQEGKPIPPDEFARIASEHDLILRPVESQD